ncbi:MAG: hypothetical protein OSB27_08385 [Planktomarina sp.]|nr:hypothetical protein [Planktomarina sp.]
MIHKTYDSYVILINCFAVGVCYNSQVQIKDHWDVSEWLIGLRDLPNRMKDDGPSGFSQ